MRWEYNIITPTLSFNKSASEKLLCVCTPFFFAPYPASSTALMITDESAVPSTPIEFVSRLTEQDVTPSTLETAFSTRALQAAHASHLILFHGFPSFHFACQIVISLVFVELLLIHQSSHPFLLGYLLLHKF